MMFVVPMSCQLCSIELLFRCLIPIDSRYYYIQHPAYLGTYNACTPYGEE